MKKVFLNILKNLGLFFLGILVIFVLGWLLFTYFYLHTPSTGFICGDSLCETVLPRIISSLSKTCLVVSSFMIVSIIVLCPLVYRKKVSKVWPFCCFFVLIVSVAYFLVIKYVSHPVDKPYVVSGELFIQSFLLNKEGK